MMGEVFPDAPAHATSVRGSGARPAPAQADDGLTLWDSDGFGFGDLLDVVNPLQHLPVLSTFYRDLTGDDIGHAARVLGGALFGGAIGAAASLANVVIDEITGDDLGGHALALAKDALGIDETAPDGSVTVADADGAAATSDGWTPGAHAMANAVDAGDHLLVARQVTRGTMAEPGRWAWVRVDKAAGPAPEAAGRPPGDGPAWPTPAAFDAGAAAAPGPAPAAPDVAPAAGPARTNVGTRTTDGADAAGAPKPSADAALRNGDALLAEAEALFRLGLEIEPGSAWARVDGTARDQSDDAGDAAPPAAGHDVPPAGGPWVAAAMQQGLDKYQAMLRQQDAPGRLAIDVEM